MRRFNIWWDGPCCTPTDFCCCKPYKNHCKGVGSYFSSPAGTSTEPIYGFPCCCDCWHNASECGRWTTTYRKQFKDRHELRMFPHLRKPCPMGCFCF